MQESPKSRPDSSGNEENLHWGIAYLREDIQDMRQEIRALREDMRQEIRALRQEMHHNYEVLLKRIDARFYVAMSMMMAMTAAIIGSIKL